MQQRQEKYDKILLSKSKDEPLLDTGVNEPIQEDQLEEKEPE